MSAPRLNPASRMTKEPSARARTRIKEGQAFGARVMDPVLEDCIEFMLIDRPMTVLPRMHDYLLSMKEGRPIEASPSSAKSLDEVLRELKPVVEFGSCCRLRSVWPPLAIHNLFYKVLTRIVHVPAMELPPWASVSTPRANSFLARPFSPTALTLWLRILHTPVTSWEATCWASP